MRPYVVTRLRLCCPQTLRSRKLRRDSCCHNLNGYLETCFENDDGIEFAEAA